jgi:hypothetical protein
MQRPRTRIRSRLALLALAVPLAVQADAPGADVCAPRLALLEKRLGALQLRLRQLEHELASRPRADAAQGAWQRRETWQQLRGGMSQAEVARLLGPPGRVTSYYGFQRWEYPDALGARVNFDESGRLLAWGAIAR